MSEAHLKDEIAELRQELDRLNRRLNVALDLLAECKMAGYPESLGLVQARLEAAERAASGWHESAGADDATGKHAAVAPVAPPPSSPSREVAPPPAAANLPRAGENPFAAPVVPDEAPLLGQQTHNYDTQTERERKLNQAIDVLGSLGKLK